MAQRKKTPEELEIAAHNRLKGTICFHVTSAISQLHVIENKLRDYYNGSNADGDRESVSSLLRSLAPIIATTKRFKIYLYIKLEIGNSPSSYRTRSPRSRKQQYPHVSNQ